MHERIIGVIGQSMYRLRYLAAGFAEVNGAIMRVAHVTARMAHVTAPAAHVVARAAHVIARMAHAIARENQRGRVSLTSPRVQNS